MVDQFAAARTKLPSELTAANTIAWQTVRTSTTHRNPFIDQGATGLEAYYVGTSDSAEQVLVSILEYGRWALLNLRRDFLHDYSKRKAVLETLTQLKPCAAGLQYWSDILGVTLAKHRIKLVNNPQGERFRESTYRRLGIVPQIKVETENNQRALIQYALPVFPISHGLNANSLIQTLPDDDQTAWLIMNRLGMLGNPLLRAALRLRSPFS